MRAGQSARPLAGRGASPARNPPRQGDI